MREDAAPLLQLPRRSIALVLAGGRGSRLKQLTDRRAKPAVPFGGKFRIIDFALSNCINSGIRRIAVLTQYKAHSLIRHLQRGWGHLRAEMNEFVDIMPASQRIDESTWYRGTADAIWQNLDIIESEGAEYAVILAGDHVYKMDYAVMLADHVASGADVTVGCVEVPRMEATAYGVLAIDDTRRIIDFVEKPADPPGMPGQPDLALASMGIYIFTTAFLSEQLRRDAADPTSSHDFGKDLIPYILTRANVRAHRLSDSVIRNPLHPESYWRDVGTLDAYWAANLDLTTITPALDLYDPDWPIYTHQTQLPPAKFVFDEGERVGIAINSTVSGGCIVSGSTVRQSLLFSQVRVNSFARVHESVILPGTVISRHARLSRCIVDSRVQIPEGLVVGEDPAEDSRRFERTADGITLITKPMLDALA